MSDDQVELPQDWIAQGWTKESAFANDEDYSAPWGEAVASMSPADPTSVAPEVSSESQA
jgi:hypothetical protein